MRTADNIVRLPVEHESLTIRNGDGARVEQRARAASRQRLMQAGITPPDEDLTSYQLEELETLIPAVKCWDTDNTTKGE